MKICKTANEFIEYVAPLAQKVCKRYSFLPSILIAQTGHENGFAVPDWFDNSGIYKLMEYNCMVGQKASLLNDTWADYSVWPGMQPGKYDEYSFEKITPEEYNGKMKNIPDRFRKFDSVEQSLADYVLFLLYSKDSVYDTDYRYGPAVVNIKDPYQLIKAVGKKYATGSSYAENVYDIVKRYNLTKYDDLTNVKPTEYVPDILKGKKEEKAQVEEINIIKKFITTNNSNSTNEPIAIVIHNTDNFARTANAYAHAEGLYHGYMQGMSWHYVVDDKEIYQCLPHNRGAWHVGRNFGSNNLFGIINNRNSIGIEMCVNAGYDYEKAFQNTVKLTKYLMKILNIPASKVYQHYDICTKDCPSQIRKRGDWQRFKALISNGATPTPSTPSPKNYLEKGDQGDAVKEMQKMLIACNYSCGSSGADGDFGNATLTALKLFQNAAGLKPDGLYGEKTKAALVESYNYAKPKQADEITVDKFLASCKKVMDTARKNKYKYGNSTAINPTTDGLISCDRLIAKALYDLGFTDQRKGGETCGTLDSYLRKHGFIRSTNYKDIKKGAIVLVKHLDKTYTGHAFVCVSFNNKTWVSDRYDAGSNDRISITQPIKSVEWAYRKDDLIVYTIPSKTPAEDKKSTQSSFVATGTATATVDDLNVRAGAGTDYKVLRTLNKGNRFEVDGKSSGKWIHVNVAGTIGYVHKAYIKYD